MIANVLNRVRSENFKKRFRATNNLPMDINYEL